MICTATDSKGNTATKRTATHPYALALFVDGVAVKWSWGFTPAFTKAEREARAAGKAVEVVTVHPA